MAFRNREDAGRQLAARLRKYSDSDAIVLALARGGVPVGYEIARGLGVPLEVIVARKLGAPGHPEFGIGAVAPGGVRVLDDRAIQALSIDDEYIERTTLDEQTEMQRRLLRFRGDDSLPHLGNRAVILVDDGLATGVTARAAAESIRQQEPRSLVLAVPVCAAQTALAIRDVVDDLICIHTPMQLGAVGMWYEDFEQTTDGKVVEFLERARQDARASEGTGSSAVKRDRALPDTEG